MAVAVPALWGLPGLVASTQSSTRAAAGATGASAGMGPPLSIEPGLVSPRYPRPPGLLGRYDEGSGGSGDESRDEAHKQEWNRFYQKQMSLRKVMGS